MGTLEERAFEEALEAQALGGALAAWIQDGWAEPAGLQEDTGVEQPLEGSGVEQTLEGTGEEKALEGTGVEQPLEGTGVEQPLEGTGEEKALEGTGVEQPLGTLSSPQIQPRPPKARVSLPLAGLGSREWRNHHRHVGQYWVKLG